MIFWHQDFFLLRDCEAKMSNLCVHFIYKLIPINKNIQADTNEIYILDI